MVFQKGDPWLKNNMPPNGFGCNCKTLAISSYRLKKEGLEVQKVGETDSIADSTFSYSMCADEMEHIKKIETVERKRSENGDTLSELALFETEYRRIGYFRERCKEVQENQASTTDRKGLKKDCGQYRESLKFCKTKISDYAKTYLISKNPKDDFPFEHIFGNLKYETVDDLELGIFTTLSYFPELSKGKVFSKVTTYKDGDRAKISNLTDELMIREDIAKRLLNIFEKFKRNRKDVKLDDFEDERALQTLFHEILHLRADRKNVLKPEVEGILVLFGEMTNEYFALQNYGELTKIFKITPKFREDILSQKGAYFSTVRRFKQLLKVLQIESFDRVELNNRLDWLNPVDDISKYLSKESGVSKLEIERVVKSISRKDFRTNLENLRNYIKR
jgi:hypothetical protein